MEREGILLLSLGAFWLFVMAYSLFKLGED
jgi:hypothetical protein